MLNPSRFNRQVGCNRQVGALSRGHAPYSQRWLLHDVRVSCVLCCLAVGGVLVLAVAFWCCQYQAPIQIGAAQYQDAVCAITSRARCERHPERVSRRSKRPRRSRRGTRLPPIQAPCRRPEQGLETAQERASEKGGWDGRKGGRRGEGEAWST